MEQLRFDLSKKGGAFKRLNAVNNGPAHKRHVKDQWRSNMEDYKAARIPFARNHDAAFFATYGGEHSVDITGIFPDFDKDPYDPSSYDFACTDEYILVTLDAGTQTFFRLGQKIEHYVKKYGTIPPKDFKKWAVICEHIIRHYNEGWGDGFNLDIKYWEIWNEPDLDDDASTNKRTWGGTKLQFFDLYEITAKHLKECFPDLYIGGPAIAGWEEWGKDFLNEMAKRNVPVDFFSWHIYCNHPCHITGRADRIRKMMDDTGYKNAESILNEWNYIRDWEKNFVYSIETIIGMKGAAFTMACISEAQKHPVDMLMYYDARPCAFNGLFDYYTFKPLKGYYPFKWYGMFYDMEAEIISDSKIEDIYYLTGCDKEGKVLSVITYYTDEDEKEDKEISIDFGKNGKYEIYLLDETHDGELLKVTENPEFALKPQSVVLIKEI